MLYSKDCIYGENRDDLAEDGVYVLCDGCKRDMALNIEDFLIKLGG